MDTLHESLKKSADEVREKELELARARLVSVAAEVASDAPLALQTSDALQDQHAMDVEEKPETGDAMEKAILDEMYMAQSSTTDSSTSTTTETTSTELAIVVANVDQNEIASTATQPTPSTAFLFPSEPTPSDNLSANRTETLTENRTETVTENRTETVTENRTETVTENPVAPTSESPPTPQKSNIQSVFGGSHISKVCRCLFCLVVLTARLCVARATPSICAKRIFSTCRYRLFRCPLC
jgi:hypothetical protein